MGPCIFKFPICGWSIYDPDRRPVSWLIQFRGLVCSSAEEGILLTGLGLYSDPQSGAFIALPDSSARWDDPRYENPTEHQFGAMTRRDVNGKHGFLFHDDCWSLVKQAYHPAPVPLERLYHVINSLPMDCLGALVLGDEKDYFSWERGLVSHQFREDPPSDILYRVSPLALSEVDDILAEPPQAPDHRHMCRPSPTPGSSLPGRDVFASLREELCSAVAACLPTADALNARLASRSFWNVYDSQQFWASRFRGADSERSAGTGTGIPRRDWRWLYHRAADARLGPAARNRKRVWALIQHLVKILDLAWNELPAELPFPLQARKPKLRRVVLPVDGILRIAASTVRLGDSGYIAGLSLTMASGHVLQLGYSAAAESECFVRLEGASVAGFNVAVGLGGIHALQCVSGSGTRRQVSAWFGCPGDAPRTERALGNLVPDVPPRRLNLNESFVVAPDAYTWGYAPLFWTCFGGRGGVYLAAFEEITIGGASGCIHFSFANPEVPDECRSFGRIADDADRDKETEAIELLIDGSGGEIIDELELCQELLPTNDPGWLARQGLLAWFKVFHHPSQSFRPGVPVVEKELSASPGTAITGFYGVQLFRHPYSSCPHRGVEFCLAMLGVITEPIHQA
ncbi:hypothetical protein C8A01DRAFT_45232 [Parachaetomium inaequale]|uniref:DUF7600 domain-containing protein n=1 Tax=Parachaetomium inaequale TaxID=2588326 RepID=A0AAN6STR1_9PEZI|nr:hypothetical protein C8A01DRAFT_45232 [Parachaetomium inaequale]